MWLSAFALFLLVWLLMNSHSGSSGYDEEDLDLWEEEMLLLLDEEDEEDE